MLKALLFSLAGLLAFPALCSAQQLYRCGNQYSQTPCDVNAAPSKISPGAAPDAAPVSRGKEVCITEGIGRLGFPDPESTRVRAVERSGTEVIQYAGKSVVAQRFNLVINTKNSTGGYTGDRVYPCYLSEDGARVLSMEAQPH